MDKARYEYTYQSPTKYYIAECSTVGLGWAEQVHSVTAST